MVFKSDNFYISFCRNLNDDTKKLWELRELCRESNIPFLIDLQAYDELPQPFQQEILRNYIVIFSVKMELLLN